MPRDTRANSQMQPAPAHTAQTDQPTLGELQAEIMKLSDVLCKKIDGLRDETSAIHRKIADIKKALQDTSDRALNIEKNFARSIKTT